MLMLDYLGGPSVITIVLKRVKGGDMKKDAEIGVVAIAGRPPRAKECGGLWKLKRQGNGFSLRASGRNPALLTP